MLFNSLSYAVFLPVVFAAYWALPHPYRWMLLLAASYFFYMSWNAAYVVLILFTTGVSYFCARRIEKSDDERKRKRYLMLALVSCLSVLFIFKYYNFFIDNISQLLDAISPYIYIYIYGYLQHLDVILPVGISFYTFQTLGYVVDVYRREIPAERNFGVYALFVSFFPQLVAGPIERTRNLLPQLKAEHRFNYDQAVYGLKLMTWGFYKKLVIADFCGGFVDKLYENVFSYNGFALTISMLFFLLQVYCDFSAYSDIARGTAKLFGVDLMENFKSSYLSASIREFWSRNHISLSLWFRDYVYIPLGGSRCGQLRHKLNLMVTFVLSGLWHGASWTFAVWGGLHGFAQIIENRMSLNKVRTGSITWIKRTFATFLFCMLTLVFFRAPTMREAFHVLSHSLDGIGSPLTYLHGGFRSLGIGKAAFAVFLCARLLPLLLFDYASLNMDVLARLGRCPAAFRWMVYVSFILLIVMLAPVQNTSAFIYFQF